MNRSWQCFAFSTYKISPTQFDAFQSIPNIDRTFHHSKDLSFFTYIKILLEVKKKINLGKSFLTINRCVSVFVEGKPKGCLTYLQACFVNFFTCQSGTEHSSSRKLNNTFTYMHSEMRVHTKTKFRPLLIIS